MTSPGVDERQAAADGAAQQAPFASEPGLPSDPARETVARLVGAVGSGRPWAPALLQAVGAWTSPVEIVDGDEIAYLLGGEAFDWLLLAERLLRVVEQAVPDAIPAAETERLLFTGELPEGISPGQFREALGVSKYRAHLNYFYGVVVEEALWHAVEREVMKERSVRGMQHSTGVEEAVSRRLYRGNHPSLVRRFRKESGAQETVKFSLSEFKEYTYWLFKHRIGHSDAARTASDTRKGLLMLSELRGVPPEQMGDVAGLAGSAGLTNEDAASDGGGE